MYPGRIADGCPTTVIRSYYIYRAATAAGWKRLVGRRESETTNTTQIPGLRYRIILGTARTIECCGRVLCGKDSLAEVGAGRHIPGKRPVPYLRGSICADACHRAAPVMRTALGQHVEGFV